MLRYLAYIYLSMIVVAAVLISRREEPNDVRLSTFNSFYYRIITRFNFLKLLCQLLEDMKIETIQ